MTFFSPATMPYEIGISIILVFALGFAAGWVARNDVDVPGE